MSTSDASIVLCIEALVASEYGPVRLLPAVLRTLVSDADQASSLAKHKIDVCRKRCLYNCTLREVSRQQVIRALA